MSTIFSSAEILLPKFSKCADKMNAWATIACDQFTSEPEYWEKAAKIVGNNDSTYNYIMPEAYLGSALESERAEIIAESMDSFDESTFDKVTGLIYVERTLPNGSIRHGIVGKIDLEHYDYAVGSTALVRATEKTVIERIPPRQKIRRTAAVEFPHVLVLVDDNAGIFECAKALQNNAEVVYDFDMMLGGGHITGYALTGALLESVTERIAEYEQKNPSLSYAIGDGNHSLAAAKAFWEELKTQGAEMDHPARYALCEITAIADKSLVFEPIYRIVKNADVSDFIAELRTITSNAGEQRIDVIANGTTETLYFTSPEHSLVVGSLQLFIDRYIAAHPGVECDYIHGEDSLHKLASEPDVIGFLFDGMRKEELLTYVDKNGTLPRKTFSMGEAESKRYYLEARRITK